MDNGFRKWKDGLFLCLLAGALWGLVALLVNSLTGAFAFEFSVVHDLVTFVIGGAVFGLVTGGFLSVAGWRLPFRSIELKAAIVSLAIWVALGSTGFVLTIIKPIRYHFNLGQTLQGLFLSVILGLILGAIWKMGLRAQDAAEGPGLGMRA